MRDANLRCRLRLRAPLLAACASAAAIFAAAQARAAGVLADPATHSVSFEAVSTDCGLDAQLEFLLVGPDSDRDYESMFVAEPSIAEIARGFRDAGIPSGAPHDPSACRFWPEGVALSIEPPLSSLVRDTDGADATPKVVFPGGTRDARGVPEACTNMPAAIFAFYNCGQSLLQFDDSLDQSPAYGRFRPAVKIPKGEKRRFTFKWDGQPACRHITLPLAPGGLEKAVAKLKDESRGGAISVLPDFSPELTLAEAAQAAQALSLVDSPRVKINGCQDGQFYYRAFMPLEKWRERKNRLAQPPEVRFSAAGAGFEVVQILEDWSDPDSLDPKLTAKTTRFGDARAAAELASSLAERTSTLLVFAPAGTKLATLHAFKRLAAPGVANWYVFQE